MSAHDYYSGRAFLSTKMADEADHGVVAYWVARLESVLFDDDETAFPSVFRDMEYDSQIGRAEAVEIATQFVSPTARSSSRQFALDKVHERWETLMASRHRTRAGPGA